MIKNGRKPANPQITLSWLPSQKARAIKKTPKIRSLKRNCNKYDYELFCICFTEFIVD